MLTINFSEGGQAISDFDVERFVLSRLSGRNRLAHVSTENVVLMARTFIAEGLVPPEYVRVIWNGEEMRFDNQGRFLNWNDGFSGLFDKNIDRIISVRRRRRQALGEF